MSRIPIYFLSHGGPNIMYETEHPAFKKLQQIGKEITTKVKPKAIIVFSAHWQPDAGNTIEVNTSETTDLIYDFYGFPAGYYKGKSSELNALQISQISALTINEEKYPNVGSKAIAEKAIRCLKSSGIETKAVSRGLDHGVWASFKVAFDPETNPLNVPIVQVSLFSSEDPQIHFALGRAVSALRSEGIAIIVSGMAVHNLRDWRLATADSRPKSYSKSFDEALKKAVESEVGEREQSMVKLLDRTDARQAHPTFDHLLPIFVGAGAAGEDRGRQLWTLAEGSMSWAQYRFGEVSVG